jgi:hypothetical protein
LKNTDQNSLSDISSEVFLLDLWYCHSFPSLTYANFCEFSYVKEDSLCCTIR